MARHNPFLTVRRRTRRAKEEEERDKGGKQMKGTESGESKFTFTILPGAGRRRKGRKRGGLERREGLISIKKDKVTLS